MYLELCIVHSVYHGTYITHISHECLCTKYGTKVQKYGRNSTLQNLRFERDVLYEIQDSKFRENE